MNSLINISWGELGLFSLIILIPLLINWKMKLKINQELLTAIARMAVQLALVGLYLHYLFELNSLWFNLLWLGLMLVIGASAILNNAKQSKRTLLLPVFYALSIATLPLLGVICLMLIKAEPRYNAQYLIPLAGMLIGNSISANIVGLQHFFNAFKDRQAEYQAAIALGASPHFACQDFVRNALKQAVAPIMATMSTTGLVTLPGMMTGQILSGSDPMLAIKYQILIMLAIVVVLFISVSLSLQLCLTKSFTSSGRLRLKTQ